MPDKLTENKSGDPAKRWERWEMTDKELKRLNITRKKWKGAAGGNTGGGAEEYIILGIEMGGGGKQTSRYGRTSGLGRRSKLSGYRYKAAAAEKEENKNNACSSSGQTAAKPCEETQETEMQKEKEKPNKKKPATTRTKTDDHDLADMKRAYSIICGIEETRNEYSYRIILEMKRSMAALKRMIDEYEKLEKIKKRKKT